MYVIKTIGRNIIIRHHKETSRANIFNARRTYVGSVTQNYYARHRRFQLNSLKVAGNVSASSESPIRNNRKRSRATSLPLRFYKCNANNNVITSPHSSYRVGHHHRHRSLSFSLSPSLPLSLLLSRRARATFMSLSCYSPSRFTLVASCRYYAPGISTACFNFH